MLPMSGLAQVGVPSPSMHAEFATRRRRYVRCPAIGHGHFFEIEVGCRLRSGVGPGDGPLRWRSELAGRYLHGIEAVQQPLDAGSLAADLDARF